MLLLFSLFQDLSGSTGAVSARCADPRGCLNSGHRHRLLRQEAEEAAERSAASTHMHEAADTEGVAREGGCGVAAADGAADAAKDTVAGSITAPQADHRRSRLQPTCIYKIVLFLCFV